MRTAQGDEPVSVLDRIIAIVEAVRECGGCASVMELARATGIPKSTASRTVAELVRRGYLERTEAQPPHSRTASTIAMIRSSTDTGSSP
jgi:IclR family acetate operon transcriptional repressor